MNKERYNWVMAYRFDSEYASESLWQAAFRKFLADLAAYDSLNLMRKVGEKLASNLE